MRQPKPLQPAGADLTAAATPRLPFPLDFQRQHRWLLPCPHRHKNLTSCHRHLRHHVSPFTSTFSTRRKVAENAAKGCDVCYRATSSVLVADEKKDFFYVCPSHLKDKNFCSPIIDKEAVEAKKKKEMEEEIERVKKEYEEKQKKKKEKDKNADKEKDKEKEKEKDKDEKKADDEKKDDDSKAADKDGAGTETPSAEEEPRVFALHKNFYGMRLEKKRQMEIAKRNRERLQQPNFFPSVPKGAPGS